MHACVVLVCACICHVHMYTVYMCCVHACASVCAHFGTKRSRQSYEEERGKEKDKTTEGEKQKGRPGDGKRRETTPTAPRLFFHVPESVP